MTDFRMPSLGADMAFGRVVEWLVKPGDRVERGQIIVEVETDKGTFEVESPHTGEVRDLAVQAGAKVPVGTVLATIAGPEPSLGDGRRPTRMETVSAPGGSPSEGVPPSPSPAEPAPAGVHPAAAPEAARVRASPLARRMAEALRIDLTSVSGTGNDGAITKADVERAAAAGTVAASTGEPTVAPEVTKSAQAAAGMRRAIAAAVSRSKREIPHYYLATDIDLGRAMEWLAAENVRRPVASRVLPAALMLKAVATALRRHPDLNGFWVDGGFRPGDGVHLGVAISLRAGGLIAPAIHNADQLSVPELMSALTDLVRRARSEGLRASEMTDATVSVTNLGDQGAAMVFGVIYPPQVALIGMGRISERAWAENGMLAARPVVTATLAADHRATDGHYGAKFLDTVAKLLAEPQTL